MRNSESRRAHASRDAYPVHRADVPKAAPRPLARRSCRTRVILLVWGTAMLLLMQYLVLALMLGMFPD